MKTAKKSLKAGLLNQESASVKLNSINSSIVNGKDTDYDNQIFDMIDSITREDIDAMAQTACYGNGRTGNIGGFVSLGKEDVTNIYRLML